MTPSTAIHQAVRAVPAVKWALGVGGLIAAIAIVFSWRIDARVAIFGTIVMLVLMTVLVIFARLTTLPARHIALPAIVFTWFALLLVIATATVLFLSVFFRKPIDLQHWLTGKPTRVTLTADSGWRGGGSSPREYCEGQRKAYQKQYPDRTVVLVDKDEDHKSEHTPFKHDYYRYKCWFVVR
ncbi:MAG TPA: hypothetical protein VF017_14045 [Thermoanaerobaculia bacterium]|nr:hypothetical protein [Thermoanaerobaculia bacterium]